MLHRAPDHLLDFTGSGLCVHHFADAGSLPEKKCQHIALFRKLDEFLQIGLIFRIRFDVKGFPVLSHVIWEFILA